MENSKLSFQTNAELALLRMKRAADRRTGCHLTSEMIEALRVTYVGHIWEQLAGDIEEEG